jgi:C_GCAxxG_C_C family probable redox protein
MTDSRSQRAMELFKQGYNCAQAVLGAFCEDLGIDLEAAVKIASSFGGGMGRLHEVCGAVSGMFMVAGLKYGYNSPTDMQAKKAHYRRIQTLAGRFEQENGSIVCKNLLGLADGKSGAHPRERVERPNKRRPCVELVGHAAEIMEHMIQNKTVEESNK